MSEGFSNVEGYWNTAPSMGVDPYLREKEVTPKLANQDNGERELKIMGWGYDNNRDKG